jgi:hypothetical protein
MPTCGVANRRTRTGGGSNDQRGIYTDASGNLARVADLTSSVPGGAGVFTDFGLVSLSNGHVAFLGVGGSNLEGLYTNLSGTLTKVIASGDKLDARTVAAYSESSSQIPVLFGTTGLSGNQIAFTAFFTDNTSGVYVATFTAVSGLAGDYNRNGTVDAADYTIWHDTLGSTTDLRADGNGNGVIDQGDYAIWKSNFGNHAGIGAGAAVRVPEPTTVSMLLIGIATLYRRSRIAVP